MTRRKLTPEQKAIREAEIKEYQKEYRKTYYREHKTKIAAQIAAIAKQKEYLYKLFNDGLIRLAPSRDDLKEYIVSMPLTTNTLEKAYAKLE